ncbi:prolyl hydroxylase family protein [Synechocystis sp. PCC 7509]|uniref:prolyl hydroxylase family protein n=1 Tax=Synechocystis sp. PCC 7509 TaxID=927677 RepID=UPI0002AD0E96|nr:2OG-Fe(II) oxygenase [Synechocystis sp. PCC 7509]
MISTDAWSVTELGADILLFERLLDCSLCNHIIQIADCCTFQTAGIELAKVETQVRSNELLYLGETNTLLQSTNQLLLNRIYLIQETLYQNYRVKFSQIETCSILRYRPGQFYKRHIDNLLLASRREEASLGVPTRDVSIVGYLNDDFVGGETFFDRQNLKFIPQKGSVIVFPSYYTHPHQSLPVTQGCKYAFTSWLFH